MTTQMIASLIHHSISLIGGVMALLLGLRMIGPKDGTNLKYDAYYRRWSRCLKWVGLLLIVFTVIQIGIGVFEGNSHDISNSYKAELRKSIENSITEKGVVAENNRVFESQDGFSILIPAGYTYSKPPNANIGLTAIRNPSTTATPVVIVAIEVSNIGIEEFSAQVKQSLLEKEDKLYKFADTTTLNNGATIVQRTNFTALRRDGTAFKGSLLLASKGKKYFLVNLVAREDLYNAHADEIEKMITSFALR